MTEANPYEMPDAELQQASIRQAFSLAATPGSRPFDCGWAWIVQGFGYFKQSWGPWIGAMLLGFVIMIVISLIPIVGQLVELLTYYIWVAGLALGCRAQAQGQPFKVSHLWAGFTSRVGSLILLSVVVNIVVFAVGFVIIAFVFPQLLTEGGYAESTEPEDVIKMLLGFLAFIPLLMATFFAPYLIIFHEIPLFRAMKLSFIGCLKNLLPLLLLGIAMLLFMLVALIPLGLGMLVLVPVFNASTYVAYEDIYLEK